jgi:putative spermidine/putrescine transport system permease protein
LIFSDIYELIGEKMELQARVLGANALQTFLHVTLPIIAPGIVSAGSMIFIVSFSQYFLTFLIGGGNIMTFSLIMFPFIQSGDRAMASSYSIVFIEVSLMLFILVEKLVKSYYKTNKYFYI